MATSEKTQRINTFIALTVLGVVIATVCIIGSITYGKITEIMQGQMEATEYRVSSKVPGRILEFRVKEGDKVKAGDTLAIIEAPEVMAKKAQAEAVKTAAQALNDKAEAGAREEQIQGAYELWQKAIVNRDIWEKSFKRVSNLFKEGVVSEQKYDETKAQYDAAVATEKAAKSQYDLAVKGAQKEDKEMAAAKVAQAKGAVAEVDSYISETILLAYADGEVTEIFPHIGELVGTGAPIMNIAMMDDMWATFNVREDHLTKLPIGSRFTAEFPALGASVVMEVNYIKDRGDYAAWKATKQYGQYDLKTFEVRAVPVAEVEGLRPGMTVIYRVGEESK
ncbi:MAG: efflux RND transporter periplasmic adaptor subunit [Bacteroidales bacterium]|nr:efflux RND transporter periplasmic adaptor subunit [Bacteroidales bacterium]